MSISALTRTRNKVNPRVENVRGQQQQQQPGGKKQTGNGAETNQSGKRQVSQQETAQLGWQGGQRKTKGKKGNGGGKK